MSIFSTIMQKIFHSSEAAPAAADAGAAGQAPGSPTSSPAAASSDSAGTGAAGTGMASSVDVEQVLTGMAATKGGGGNWQSSIVDLLKLLDLDFSLNARKELATEMNVHAGADGTAEQNIALHKAVMQKMAENGGKVPDSLKG